MHIFILHISHMNVFILNQECNIFLTLNYRLSQKMYALLAPEKNHFRNHVKYCRVSSFANVFYANFLHLCTLICYTFCCWFKHNLLLGNKTVVWLPFMVIYLYWKSGTGRAARHQPAVEDGTCCYSSLNLPYPSRAAVCTRGGCEVVFRKWAKTTTNLELHWQQPF